MLNLVIDFNNLAMRSLFMCKYIGEGNVTNFDTEEECDIYINKLSMDICSVLRTIAPDRVIFVCDSKNPWRNKLYADIDGMEYKGTREKDEEKNWDNIFNSLTDFKNILKDRGFVVSEIASAEADDLAALWKEELVYKNMDPVILVSSDKDWTQLVEFVSSTAWCFCFNPVVNNKGIKKFFIDEKGKNWLETEEKVDIFLSGLDPLKDRIKGIIASNPRLSVEQINPNAVLLDKIFCGDDGDNVPAIFDYYKNGKKMRVTPLKAGHIYESLGISNSNDIESHLSDDSLRDAISKEMKTDVDVDLTKRLDRQRKLVELKSRFFPDSINKNFEVDYFGNLSKGVVNTRQIKTEDLLGETKFLKKDFGKPRENSIFDDIKSLGVFSKAPNLF